MAGQLGLPKGTVHGILRTLQSVGFVEQDHDSGKYQLGAAVLHIGYSYLDANELRTRALDWADSLATQSSESVRIGMLHERQVLIVHHVFRPDDSRQALDVGSLVPLHAAALGKALLAHNRYLLADLENPPAGLARSTISDKRELERELDVIQARGWASERGEPTPGMASIAAPIEDRRGVIAGAIGVSGPIERLCQGSLPRLDLAGYVMESARAVSRELGAA
jgi:DNA-binding IclR family transcriptional regulator